MNFRKPLLSACAALVCASLASVSAQSPSNQVITAVEEDWSLVINSPDVTGIGPQVTTCMRPAADDATPFVAFDLNYREYPTFQVGGMQIQVWANNRVVNTSSQGTAQFQTANETVTWTQRMSISNGTVTYDVDNGQSTTWGKFGQGQGLLELAYTTTLADMSGYNPDTSVAKSGVTWEADRADSLTLVQVRYYSNGQLVSTDTNPRSVKLTK